MDKSKTQQDGAERAEMQGEQPKKKKKFTAVFRPENAQQIRVKNSGNEGAKPQEKAVPEKAAEKTAEKPKENVEKKPETAAPQKKPADSRPPIKTAVSSRLPQGRSAEETRLAIQSRLNALGNSGPRNGGQQRGQHRENDDDTGKGGHHLPDALRIFFLPEPLRLGEKFGAAAPAEFDQDALAHLDLRGAL